MQCVARTFVYTCSCYWAIDTDTDIDTGVTLAVLHPVITIERAW